MTSSISEQYDQPTPAPVDLDGLAAELEASGWKPAHAMPYLIRLYRTEPHEDTFELVYRIEWSPEDAYIDIGQRMFPKGQFRAKWDAAGFNAINALDPIWQHAIDIIRRHTQPTEGASE